MQRQTSYTHSTPTCKHTDTYDIYTTHTTYIQQIHNTHNIETHIHTHVLLCILQFRAENKIAYGSAYNEASFLNMCSFLELDTKDETVNLLRSCDGIVEEVARTVEKDQNV